MLFDIERDETVVDQVVDVVEPLLANVECAVIIDFVVFRLIVESL